MSDAGPIELAPIPGGEPPPFPGTVIVRELADEVLDASAADLLLQALACVREFGDFHMAVSASARTEPLLKRLMYDPDLRRFPWPRTQLYLTDEACVPENDERRRFPLVRDWIVDFSGIPKNQVHSIDPVAAEGEHPYATSIRDCLVWREKGHDRLDYVLLGLEDDGRIAGLRERDTLGTQSLVRWDPGEEGGPPRVTMTQHLINASRFIAVLAMGDAAAPAVRTLADFFLSGAGESIPGPAAAGLKPVSGELRWYLDAAANRWANA